MSHVQIRASAGAGKTFQLTNRFLCIVARGEPVEHLLASTFSRKAAGEIIERVLLRLADAALDDNKARDLGKHIGLDGFGQAAARTLLLSVTKKIHRLSIGTLDAFFMALVQSFGFELGFAPGWKILDEAMLDVVRQTAVRQALEEGDDADLMQRLNAIYRGEPRQSVFSKIDDVVKELLPDYLESGPAPWAFRPAVATPARPLADVIRDLKALAVEPRLQEVLAGDIRALERDYKAIFDKGVFKAYLNNQEAPAYNRKALPPALAELMHEVRDHVRAMLVDQLAEEMQAYSSLLHAVTQRITKLKARLSGYGFDDIARLLAAKLMAGLNDGTLAEVYFRLDQRIHHMLLDEFQDTSLAQWQVLSGLATEITSHFDGSRSFFCVGDVKQAIYGWRGGVSEIFDAITQELPNVSTEPLNKSRRSSKIVIDVVNRMFSTLQYNPALADYSAAKEQWLAGFSDHETAREDLPGYARLVVAKAADEPSEQHVVTLGFVADEVKRLHQEAPNRSVGVLVRRNASVQRLIYELSRRDVVASEEGGNPLTDSPAVMLVLSLLQLADHPGDTVARFHVARSPLGELIGYEDYTSDKTAADLSLRIREQMIERGFSRTIRHYAQRLAAKVDARNAGRLAQLCELSERYENQVGEDMQGALRPASFVAFVRLMRMEEPQPAAVRVMTIHQSKGLEFDIVVVCDIEEPLRGHGYPLVAFERPSPVHPPSKAFRFLRTAYVALLPELAEMNAQAVNLNVRERLSNLYVAITRPRHALHIVVQPNPKGQKTVSAVVRQALAPNSALTPGQTIFEVGDAKWFAVGSKVASVAAAPPPRAPIRLRQPKHRAVRRSPSAMEGGTRVDVGEHLRLDRRPGLARGSLIHKWLEGIEWLDDGEPSDATLLALTPQKAKGLALEEELLRLRHALQADAVRQALSRARFEGDGALRVYRELPFAVREGEVLLSGSFDRVVVARGDRTHVTIIDFKTDRVNEADLAERVAYYRPQMDAYRRAAITVFRAHIEDVRCELIFLALGKVIPVTESLAR